MSQAGKCLVGRPFHEEGIGLGKVHGSGALAQESHVTATREEAAAESRWLLFVCCSDHH